MTDAFLDLLALSNISDYKWLSKTLKNAQKQNAVRPFFQCKVVDDSIIGDALTNPVTPTQGSACTAPDGSMFAVGESSGYGLAVWEGTTGSLSGAPITLLVDTSHDRSSLNHYAISCSDWINGTYKLDVYAFGNWDNNSSSGVLSILHWYSMDKGLTWHTDQVVNDTLIPYNRTKNIWIAAGQAFQNDAGNILSTVFYIESNSAIGSIIPYDIAFQQYLGASGTYEPFLRWSRKDANSNDWIIHSLDVAYIEGIWRIAFSGFHQISESVNQDPSISNYSIYITSIPYFSNTTGSDGEGITAWTVPVQIISALSTSPLNANSFIYPNLYWDSKILWVFFQGTIVSSILNSNGATNVSLSVNYFLAKSVDFQNFSYPVPSVFGGNLFTDTGFYSFILQGGFYWVVGNGQVGKYIINNIIADVSDNILQYEAMDTSQNPSTINIDIGNQNGQWRGASPTRNGYPAIANNKKICMFQGYYNVNGVAEIAPKNTYYIDDIQQNIQTNRNDFNLLSRDLYKNLKVLTTKFAFGFNGIRKYIDLFDGTTMGNYVFGLGTWDESKTNINSLNQTNAGAGDVLASFSLYQQVKANTTFCISMLLMNPSNSAGHPMYIYPCYIDANNFVRLKIDANGSGTTYAYTFERCIGGAFTTFTSGTFAAVGSFSTDAYPFLFIRQGYFLYGVSVGANTSDGQSIGAFDTPTVIAAVGSYAAYFESGVGTIALGGLNTQLVFRNFRYLEFSNSLNIKELIQSIATKAGIFDYKMPTIFEDHFFDTGNYNGTFTAQNRVLTIAPGNVSMKTDLQISDGEIEMEMQMTAPNNETQFDIIFRNTGYVSWNENYIIRIVPHTSTKTIKYFLFNTHLGVEHTLVENYAPFFDFNQYHNVRVSFFGGYIFLIIDGIIVLSWFDNNTASTPTTGYIGFKNADLNQTLKIKSVVGNDLFTQIETFTINPGDDLESAIESLISTIRVYFFSDLMGKMKVLRLNSSDPSKYTYQNQITTQQVDNSDKEYVNQVTVVGTNVQATAKDIASINSNGIVREEVIVDYKITTFSDATARAQLELINFNKFNNQYTPQSIINVGSEIYDVITVINTGDNTSNVSQDVRNYSQDMQVGGDKLSYWQTVETGKL